MTLGTFSNAGTTLERRVDYKKKKAGRELGDLTHRSSQNQQGPRAFVGRKPRRSGSKITVIRTLRVFVYDPNRGINIEERSTALKKEEKKRNRKVSEKVQKYLLQTPTAL